MSQKKIDNTFDKMIAEMERFAKVVKKDGSLEKTVMESAGNVSKVADVRAAIEGALIAIHDAKGKNLTEGVLDDNDDDGFMARSQLYFLARDAIQLHSMIGDTDNLEPWVQSKISQSAEAIDAVRRYTEYHNVEAEYGDEEMGPEMEPDMEEGHTIMPPIDREKYQEREDLEGPIITKSGKVVYYDPKEGQYYDPDTDMYLSYDDWKALDESIFSDMAENVDFGQMLRYTQLEAEGRLEEAKAIEEAFPLIPLAIAGARAAAPWIIRSLAGKGATNVAKKLVKRGAKKTGQVMKRALRSRKNKAKAGTAAATGAAPFALPDFKAGDAGDAGTRGGVDIAKMAMSRKKSQMNDSVIEGDKTYSNHEIKDEHKPFIAMGHDIQDSLDRNNPKFIEWPMDMWNKAASLSAEFIELGASFASRSPVEAVKKAGLTMDEAKLVINSMKKGKYVGETVDSKLSMEATEFFKAVKQKAVKKAK